MPSLTTWIRPVAVGLSAALLAGPSHTLGQEWSGTTGYYEDSATFDLSEWAEANDLDSPFDYRATDESVGRIHQERYQAADIIDDDADVDRNKGLREPNELYGERRDDDDSLDRPPSERDDYLDFNENAIDGDYNNEYDFDGRNEFDPITDDDGDRERADFVGPGGQVGVPDDSPTDEYYYYDEPGYTDFYEDYVYEDDIYDSYDEDETVTPFAGFNNRTDTDDWFYDYYDDGYAYAYDDDGDGRYEYNYRFFDYNRDGMYDSLATSGSPDAEGRFTSQEIYSFNDDVTDDDIRLSRRFVSSDARQQRIRGPITRMKTVTLPSARHRVAQIRGRDGEPVTVDLGPVGELDEWDLRREDVIEVAGRLNAVGDRDLILADTVRFNGEQKEIRRDRRRFSGEITDMHQMQVHGEEHQFVMIERNGRRNIVDLGAAGELQNLNLQQGDRITVHGPPVEINGLRIVMAQDVEHDGRRQEIDRWVPNALRDSADQRRARDRQSDRGDRQARTDGERQSETRQRRQQTRDRQGDARQNRQRDVRDPIAGERDVEPRRVFESHEQVYRDDDRAYDGRSERDRQREDRRRAIPDRSEAARNESTNRRPQTRAAYGPDTLRIPREESFRDRNRSGDSQRDRDSQASRSGQQPRRGNIQGEVRSLREVTVRDSLRKIALVSAGRGDNIVIDLGPADQFRADLRTGDRLSASGYLTRSDDQPVLVARQFRANNRSYQVPSQSAQHDRARFTGTVKELTTGVIDGQRRRIITLLTEDGRSLQVDLGAVGQVELEHNEPIQVRGIFTRTTGDDGTLIATEVIRRGEQISIEGR